MDALIKFYKDILEMLDLEITDEGLININIGGDVVPLHIGNLPAYLPTDDNIRNMVDVSSGSPKPNKVLFNPLQEDVIKGTNESFLTIKKVMELKLVSVAYQIGESLLGIIANKSEINDMSLIKFINMLNGYKAPGMKQVIDGNTVKLWVDLYSEILSNLDYKYIKFYIKKGGKIDNVKYNRVGTITYPLYEKVTDFNIKTEKLLGYKLRNKDKFAIETLLKFMFGSMDIKDNQFGSFNKISPSMHTLFMLYDHTYKSLEPIINALIDHGVEDDVAKKLTIRPLPIRIEAIGDFIDNLENKIKSIPIEGEVVRRQQQTAVPVNSINDTKRDIAKKEGSFWDRFGKDNNKQIQQTVQPVNPYQQQVQQPMVQQQQQMVQQQPNMYQQPTMQQPSMFAQRSQEIAMENVYRPNVVGVQQPAFNTMQQPAVNPFVSTEPDPWTKSEYRGMMQQPNMYQQPMMQQSMASNMMPSMNNGWR